MLTLVINQVSKLKNKEADDFLEVCNNSGAEVEDAYYTETVFESREKYALHISRIKSNVAGAIKKSMIETPLAFVRGSRLGELNSSFPGKGIKLAYTLIDYRSKKPLIIASIDKVGSAYVYSAQVFEKETNSYRADITNLTCESIQEYETQVINKTLELVKSFTNKY